MSLTANIVLDNNLDRRGALIVLRCIAPTQRFPQWLDLNTPADSHLSSRVNTLEFVPVLYPDGPRKALLEVLYATAISTRTLVLVGNFC